MYVRQTCKCLGDMTVFLTGSYSTVVFRITQIEYIISTNSSICQNNDMDYLPLLHTHTHIIHVCLQLKAHAPQTSSSARPPCTASPNCGFVMRTPTVQTGQTRLIAVSCRNPLNHKSHHFTYF